MYNKVIMLGRIVQDLELKTTPTGVSVLSFRIAVDRRFQNKGEDRKADFFDCVAWRQEAEFISRYWTKGRPILVEGELQNRSYVDKNGNTRYITEIIVDRATFTGDKKPEGGGGYRSDAGFPEPPPEHPGSGTNSAPTSSNGDFTSSDFKSDKPGDDGDGYPF